MVVATVRSKMEILLLLRGPRGCPHCIFSGSFKRTPVLLNLLNEFGKSDKMQGLPSILSLFRNESDQFDNTGARMLDSIYHMT